MFEYDAEYSHQFFTSTPIGVNSNGYLPPTGVQMNFDAFPQMCPQQGMNMQTYQQCVPHQNDVVSSTTTSVYHSLSVPHNISFGMHPSPLSPVVSYSNQISVAQELSNNDSTIFNQPQMRKRSAAEDSSGTTSGYFTGNSPNSFQSTSSLMNTTVNDENAPPLMKRQSFDEQQMMLVPVTTAPSLEKPASPSIPAYIQDQRYLAQRLKPPMYYSFPPPGSVPLNFISNYDIEKNVEFNDVSTYAEVPGRLTLLNTNTKYKMTVGEVYRRITPPEFLNASFLGGILRMAKNRNGGSELRERLRGCGIGLPAGRRKSRQCTTFTPLTEGEARQMALDYTGILDSEFPVHPLAKLQYSSLASRDVDEVCNALEIVDELMNEIMCLMHTGDSSSYESQKGHYFCEPDQQQSFDGFVRLNRLTHGHGNLATMGAWNAAQRLFRELKDVIKARGTTSGGVLPMAPFVAKPNQDLPIMISHKNS